MSVDTVKLDKKINTACILFEDGNILYGQGFGSEGSVIGELCFNTSMTGYQEIMTDPSANSCTFLVITVGRSSLARRPSFRSTVCTPLFVLGKRNVSCALRQTKPLLETNGMILLIEKSPCIFLDL